MSYVKQNKIVRFGWPISTILVIIQTLNSYTSILCLYRHRSIHYQKIVELHLYKISDFKNIQTQKEQLNEILWTNMFSRVEQRKKVTNFHSEMY